MFFLLNSNFLQGKMRVSKQLPGLSYGGRSLAARYGEYGWASEPSYCEILLNLAIKAEKEGDVDRAEYFLSAATREEEKEEK